MRTKKEVGGIILRGLLVGGTVAVAATSPYFLSRVMPKVFSAVKYRLKKRKEKESFRRSFYYLKKRGLVRIEKRGKQIYVSLTEEGKKKVGRYQINNLQIKKPKNWDKQWRILIFDISDKHKIKREALRGKLKELGLYMIQKSVWACPYGFQREIEILRNFFALHYKEMRVITASEIENDKEIRLFFNLS